MASETAATLLAQLEALRGRRAVLCHAAMEEDTIPILYECLRGIGRTEALDVVLSTSGGFVPPARQIAMLLREFTAHLAVLVPYRARSAGTLLCLAADELVLGPLSQLGPLDALMSSAAPVAPGQPNTISIADVRAFRDVSQDWFGVDRAEDRLQVLALLATRIFPISLASFYRADKLVREVATELLTLSRPGAPESARIVDRLVGGYHHHDVLLARGDVRALGLPVADASAAEEDLLWALARTVPRSSDVRLALARGTAVGLIQTGGFRARQMVHRLEGEPVEGGLGWDITWDIDGGE